MATFRELFDEREREEILIAMQARLNALKSRHTKASYRTEQAPNPVTIERLEGNLAMVERIIHTIVEENN